MKQNSARIFYGYCRTSTKYDNYGADGNHNLAYDIHKKWVGIWDDVKSLRKKLGFEIILYLKLLIIV